MTMLATGIALFLDPPAYHHAAAGSDDKYSGVYYLLG
jgi:hypothetical protein